MDLGGGLPDAEEAAETEAEVREEVEEPPAEGEYTVDYEAPSGDRRVIKLSRVKYDDLPEAMQKVVDDQINILVKYPKESADYQKWVDVKLGQSEITLIEDTGIDGGYAVSVDGIRASS